MNVIEYKKYIGQFDYNQDDKSFTGHVINVKDMLTFDGDSIKELEASLKKTIDTYLEYCKKHNEIPDKPIGENIVLHIDPEFRHLFVEASNAAGFSSLNSWAVAILSREADKILRLHNQVDG